MRSIGKAAALVLVGSSACSEPVRLRSEAGQAIAEHLCPIQGNCECREEYLIEDCEARVERHFAQQERTALDAGLTFDAGCLEAFLDEIDDAGTCGPVQWVPVYDDPPPCPVYGGDRDVGEACRTYASLPLMTDCRAGLICGVDGICRDFWHLPIVGLGERCVESTTVAICADGLHCDADSDTCVVTPTPPPLGSVCTASDACGIDGHCRTEAPDVWPSEDSPGTCEPRTTKEGEPCEYPSECVPGSFCVGGCSDDDPFPASTPGTCYMRPPLLCNLLLPWFDEPVDPAAASD